ncbi:MAG TPA: hypothetical protein VK886_21000, partial [Vicinamibacterales bacterium]|nr:hypothetical protein [Vicinamibacterales bacterium]
MLSSFGFRDGLGERDLEFDREGGQIRERLFLRAELAAYESALRRRVGRLASLQDPSLAVVEGVEHDRASRRLVVVSRHLSGTRLTDALRTARERELVPDFTIGLFLTAEILSAAHTFHALSGLPHGAISPHSVVLTTDLEVVLTDYAYAEVIEAAHFSARRLWEEFGIAHWLGEPFSFAGDIHQSALVAIALMLGRPLGELDLPLGMNALLSEVEEAALIRGGKLFAEPVVSWLQRALSAGHASAFSSADDAADACRLLLTERERRGVRSMLAQFLGDLEAAAETTYDVEPTTREVEVKPPPVPSVLGIVEEPIAPEEQEQEPEPEPPRAREPRTHAPSSVIPFPRRESVIAREEEAVPELEPTGLSEPEEGERVEIPESEPAAFAAPDPEMFEPKPVFTELDLVAWLRPQPTAAEPPATPPPEPEPIAALLEPEPIAAFEPEPIAALEPEPIAALEPEPIAALEREPIAALEPEPIAALEPEPIAALEPEPIAALEP